MAVTEYYVDKDSGDNANGGTGWGDAWEDVVYALDTGIGSQGATGDRINLRGTHVLTKDLNSCAYFSSYTSSVTKPVWFCNGNLGSQAAIDGNGLYSIMAGLKDAVCFIDLELRNTGANQMIQIDDYGALIRCNLHGCSASTGVYLDIGSVVADCKFYDFSGHNAFSGRPEYVYGCWFSDESNVPTYRQCMHSGYGAVIGCLIECGSCKEGIESSSANIIGNTIIGSPTAERGIDVNTDAYITVANNLVANFTKGNGVGIEGGNLKRVKYLLAHNAVYNCTTAYSGDITEAEGWSWVEDNEILAIDPFVDAANGDYTPVDVGNVKSGGWPRFDLWLPGGARSYPWKGAIQPASAAAGGGIIMPGIGRLGVHES